MCQFITIGTKIQSYIWLEQNLLRLLGLLASSSTAAKPITVTPLVVLCKLFLSLLPVGLLGKQVRRAMSPWWGFLASRGCRRMFGCSCCTSSRQNTSAQRAASERGSSSCLEEQESIPSLPRRWSSKWGALAVPWQACRLADGFPEGWNTFLLLTLRCLVWGL